MIEKDIYKNIQKIENGLIENLNKQKWALEKLYEDIVATQESVYKKFVEIRGKEQEIHTKMKIIQDKLKEAKQNLAQARKDFDPEKSLEIKFPFKDVHHIQTELMVLEQEERKLEDERNKIQYQLNNSEANILYAEDLQRKIAIMSNFVMMEDANKHDKEQGEMNYSVGLKILEAQENEKKRIAREIHDGPAQMLANILMQHEFIEQSFRQGAVQEALKEVKEMRVNIEHSLGEIRQIIFDLRPMILDDLGIAPTMKRHVLTMESRFGIPIHLHIKGFDKRLRVNCEAAIFRLVQEAIQNAISHANASEIDVSLEMLNQHVNIIVMDNGEGFNVKKVVRHPKSFGLLGMKERIDLLEGVIAIDSKENIGTTIKMRIPIGKANVTE